MNIDEMDDEQDILLDSGSAGTVCPPDFAKDVKTEKLKFGDKQ